MWNRISFACLSIVPDVPSSYIHFGHIGPWNHRSPCILVFEVHFSLWMHRLGLDGVFVCVLCSSIELPSREMGDTSSQHYRHSVRCGTSSPVAPLPRRRRSGDAVLRILCNRNQRACMCFWGKCRKREREREQLSGAINTACFQKKKKQHQPPVSRMPRRTTLCSVFGAKCEMRLFAIGRYSADVLLLLLLSCLCCVYWIAPTTNTTHYKTN